MTIARISLGTATMLMALIAGFFYAYACSVMIGLDRADDRTFIVAMQEINASVRNAWFAPSFFGSLVVTGLSALLIAVTRDRRTLGWTVLGAVFYTVAFGITLAISVPLNNDLAGAGPVDSITDLASVRADYETPWVRWNIARTVTSTVALLCLVLALMVQPRGQLARSPGEREAIGQ
jgi:uncharacterized membrane protein